MRFNNEDYLRAFPREDRTASIPATPKQILKDEPGDVTDTSDNIPASDAADPEPDDTPEGGGEDGGE